MLITISGTFGNVLRLQPPLSITAAQCDLLVAAVAKTLAAVRSK
jgi:4-aminobutyrate aminotransferase-like enzyme